MPRQLEVLVHNHTIPGGRHGEKKDEENCKIKSKIEPERHNNLNRQLPALLTSPEFQAVFTQHQLDTALYGYAKYNSRQNQTSVGPALSGLRPAGLSYGTLLATSYYLIN